MPQGIAAAMKFASSLVLPLLSTVLSALPHATFASPSILAVQRCESDEDPVIYTDRACAAFGARATPMPDELLVRLVNERSRAASLDRRSSATDVAAYGSRATASAPARRSPQAGCARTPEQLSRDLRGALALRNVNRLAESFHWVGIGHRQGHRLMDRLQRLSEADVRDAHFFDAQIAMTSDGDAAGASGSGRAGMLQLLIDNGTSARIVGFDVRRYSGCYFVSF